MIAYRNKKSFVNSLRNTKTRNSQLPEESIGNEKKINRGRRYGNNSR